MNAFGNDPVRGDAATFALNQRNEQSTNDRKRSIRDQRFSPGERVRVPETLVTRTLASRLATVVGEAADGAGFYRIRVDRPESLSQRDNFRRSGQLINELSIAGSQLRRRRIPRIVQS